MKFHRKKRENLDITLVSMIDVLFVLLLFFMVSTTFNKPSEINIQLPVAAGETSDQPAKTITLGISAQGVYSLVGEDGMPHELVNQSTEGLKLELQKLAQHSQELPFIINADGKAPHQAVITALDNAGQVGFTRITFATQQAKLEQPQ
jgi:biopolymer transport protein ExbD